MNARLTRTRAAGQSIPLIALLIVVLIGAVGLAVDVGNDYAQQRNTVRGTNAAALAGMNAMIQGVSDQAVGQVIQQSLKSNKIDGIYGQADDVAGSNQRIIQAHYLDSKGNYIGSCNIGSCVQVPTGATYIEVKVNGTVDTYFARVLQRPTLPVKAQAFAGRCPAVQGVYPIAIQSSTIANNKFKMPDDPNQQVKPYWDPAYQIPNYPTTLTKRRIYLKDNADAPGNFSYLRWQAAQKAGDATNLAAMIKIPGTLANGFEEVTPWPDPNSQPPIVNGKVVYPIKPGELNADDWLYGNSGFSGSKAVDDALQEHVRNDIMILPIVDPAIGQGVNTKFQVAGLGAFYLDGFGGNGANAWFDLVYVGSANSIACLSTPAVAAAKLGITAPVFLKPRWSRSQSSAPIAFEVIMDVSGSMSWNFAGQGNKGGSGAILQCEAVGNLAAENCNGGNDYWKTKEQRRIYVLKQALIQSGGFIDAMKNGDKMRIISFSTTKIDGGTTWYGVDEAAALKQSVLDAGKYNGDSYRTSGSTPGPQALQKATQILSSSPPPAPANGLSYRHVVIYLTDGVANVFLNGDWNYAKDVCPEFGGDERALNTARCQYDQDNYAANPKGERPISAMITQAGKLKKAYDDMQLFVVALANVNPLGLDEVASNPKMLYLATTPDLVKIILDQIRDKVEAPCTETGNPDYINFIDSGHTGTVTAPPPQPLGVHGYLKLYDQNYTPVNVPWTGTGADPRGSNQNYIPISQDGLGGKLGVEIPATSGLAPGIYHMQAYVYYKAAAPEGDGFSRKYDHIIVNGQVVQDKTFTLTPQDLLGASKLLDPVRLDLDPDAVLCK